MEAAREPRHWNSQAAEVSGLREKFSTLEQRRLGFLSRPPAQPPAFPPSPHPTPPRPGLIGSPGSQAPHASSKFQLQKLIRGPTALALKAPSVSSKSHGLRARERLLKVTLNTNRKHTRALTPNSPEAALHRVHTTAPHHRFVTFSILLEVSGLVFYPAPWGSLPTHLAEAVFIYYQAPWPRGKSHPTISRQ